MSNDIYKIIVTAARERSFIKSAAIHNLSPSAISHAVNNLERNLGFPLFHRYSNGVELTQNGELLLPYMQSIVNGEEYFQQVAADIIGMQRGSVRIGIFRSVMVLWGPQLISSFRVAYPGIELIVYQGGYPEILDWIKRGSIDLAFLSGDTIAANALKCAKVDFLHRDRMVCIVPLEYKPKNGSYVTWEELKEQKLINEKEGEDIEQKKYFNQHGLSYRPQYYISDDDAIIAMVECGFGIAILPELTTKHVTRNAAVYPLVPVEYRTICLVSLAPKSEAPAVKQMRKHIIDFVHQNGWYNF